MGGAAHSRWASQGTLAGKAESSAWQGGYSPGGRVNGLDQRCPDLADHENHLGELHESQTHPDLLTQNFSGLSLRNPP